MPRESIHARGRAKPDRKNRCQRCGNIDESTCSRTLYTKSYIGPCADSFCYASCDSESCKPITVTVCDDCAAKVSR